MRILLAAFLLLAASEIFAGPLRDGTLKKKIDPGYDPGYDLGPSYREKKEPRPAWHQGDYYVVVRPVRHPKGEMIESTTRDGTKVKLSWYARTKQGREVWFTDALSPVGARQTQIEWNNPIDPPERVGYILQNVRDHWTRTHHAVDDYGNIVGSMDLFHHILLRPTGTEGKYELISLGDESAREGDIWVDALHGTVLEFYNDNGGAIAIGELTPESLARANVKATTARRDGKMKEHLQVKLTIIRDKK